jgi:hypothetical protein
MEPEEPETQVFESPSAPDAPAPEEPAQWDGVRPRYFGVTPRGLAAVLAAFALGAGVVLLVSGYLAVGALLVLAAALLAALYAEQARRRRDDTTFDRVAAAAADHTRALAGFTGSSVRAWTSAGREIARLRLEVNRRARDRAQLQYALGGATYAGDEEEVARLRNELQAVDERIAACIEEAGGAVERMRSTTARERLAVAATEVRRPDDAQS